MIRSTCQNIEEFGTECQSHNAPYLERHLVDLFNGCCLSANDFSMEDEVNVPLEVQNVWHRMIESHLVVGVTLKHTGNRYVLVQL